MRIESINSSKIKTSKKPSFGNWERTVFVIKNGEKRVLHRNNTWLYREEGLTKWLLKYISEKFCKVKKINVYNYACSNGLETYTFLMELLSNYDDNLIKKIGRIKATDYDSFAIKTAKKGIVEIDKFEKERIEKNTNGNFSRFFSSTSEPNKFKVNPILSDQIDFSVADIKKDIRNIEPANSIVIAKNFWPYLRTEKAVKKLSKDLYNQLGENSIVVIGDYDIYGGQIFVPRTDKHLQDAGFKLIEGEKVFGK